MDFLDFADKGRLKITAKTGAGKTQITGYDPAKRALKVDVHAQPEKGKANAEIIRFFSKQSKKKVEIISGKTAKLKTLKFS